MWTRKYLGYQFMIEIGFYSSQGWLGTVSIACPRSQKRVRGSNTLDQIWLNVIYEMVFESILSYFISCYAIFALFYGPLLVDGVYST